MKTIIQKSTVIALSLLCFCTLGLNISLDDYFYRTRPREPELASGSGYPEWIHHGTRVYLTRVETWPFEYSWYACGTIVPIVYLLNQRWRCFGPFTK
jgi:hypothetical protein